MIATFALCGFSAQALCDEATSQSSDSAAQRPEWEVVFDELITNEEYARQLDYFGIEIAALSKSGRVEYLVSASAARPEKRVGHRDDDARVWIGWKSGHLHAVDRHLLRKAGVSSQQKQLVHYLPEELREHLEQLETEFAGRPRAEIRRTRFQIQPSGTADDKPPAEYTFVVLEQDPPRQSITRTPTVEKVDE